MTIQMVSFGADLLMLLTAAAAIVLILAAAVQFARQRRHAAALLAGVLVALVMTYGAVLIAVGLASSMPPQLRPGDTKCFDDWCATMTTARLDTATGTLTVDLQLENRGRGRPMRSDLARAYLEMPGRPDVAPLDRSGMQTMLPAGQKVDVRLAFPAAQNMVGARLVVVEDPGGIGPGTFEIGGEGSPFHSKVGWALSGP